MKVKIVLAAAMWQNPHVLILDEPLSCPPCDERSRSLVDVHSGCLKAHELP